MGLVLISIVVCLFLLALINALIQVGHPICAFFIFNFLITSIIIVGNAIIKNTSVNANWKNEEPLKK